MKGKLSRMLRSGLSLMLVLCMLVSMAPAVFATNDDASYEVNLDELYTLLEQYGPEILDNAYSYVEGLGYVEALSDALADLKSEAEAKTNAYLNTTMPAIEKAVADLEAEIADLDADLVSLVADLEAKKAELEAAENAATENAAAVAAELEAAIAELEAAIAAVQAEKTDIKAAMTEMVNAALAIGAELSDLNDAIVALEASIEALDASVATAAAAGPETIVAAFEAAKDAVEAAIGVVADNFAIVENSYALVADLAAAVVEKADGLSYIVVDELAKLEQLIAENPEIVAEVEANIEEAKANIEAEIAALQADLEAQIPVIQAEAEAKIAELQAEVEKQIAALEAEIADLEASLELSEEQKAEIEAAIAEKLAEIEALQGDLEAAVAAIKAEAEEQIAAAKAEAEAKIAELQAEIEKIVPAVESAIEAKIAEIKAEAEALAAAVEAKINEAIAIAEAIIAKVEAAIDAVETAYINAVSADLVMGDLTKYVALGDASAASESYVDLLAGELALAFEGKTVEALNMASATNTIGNAVVEIKADDAAIADADLITVGYGNEAFAKAAIDQMFNAMFGSKVVTYDWTALIGAEGAAYVAQILDELNAELVARGLDIKQFGMQVTAATAMTMAVESYAYGVVEYVINLPAVIAELRAVNTDAVIVIVGMNNPLKGATLAFEDMSLNVGEYLDYLVEAANVYGVAYCMVTANAIYVDASDAETEVTGETLEMIPFVMNFVKGDIDLTPNANGHAYIEAQILNALNLTEQQPEVPEIPEDPEIPEEPENVVRYYGDSRYDTSMAVADAMKEELGVDKFQCIILANGMNFADALVGTYLASQKSAPILLTEDKKAADVNAYINANLADGGLVYVLGGEAAVSEKALNGINTKNIVRLYGDTRYETNLKILEEAGVNGGAILICTGMNYADSLSASAAELPILLVGDELSAEQKAFLEANDDNTYFIIGGEAAVSEKVEKEVQDILDFGMRLQGMNRYETSVLVAKTFARTAETVVLASGEAFADGLCGGPLAVLLNASVILTNTKNADVAADYVAEMGFDTGVVLGGDARITNEIVKTIFGE